MMKILKKIYNCFVGLFIREKYLFCNKQLEKIFFEIGLETGKKINELKEEIEKLKCQNSFLIDELEKFKSGNCDLLINNYNEGLKKGM